MTAPRRVVIDDADNRIHYTGQNWFQDNGSHDKTGNYGPTYQRTSHGTNNNDSLSFSFQGTSIAVFGTTQLARIDNGTRWDPSWECFVDQVSIGSTNPFEFAENNWLLCGNYMLKDGSHTLMIKVTTAGKTFWLDYLIFAPSPQFVHDEVVSIVDNRDPGILFGPGWGNTGNIGNQTTNKGSKATFNFTGRKVTWIGFIPRESPHSPASGSFSIDGGSPVSFDLAGLPSGGTTQYNQAFFTTPDLTPGPHSLVVTYNGADEPATPLVLDHLFVVETTSTGGAPSLSPSIAPPAVPNGVSIEPSGAASLTPPSVVSSTSHSETPPASHNPTPPSSSSSASTPSVGSPTDTHSGTQSQHRSPSTPIGVIIGGVVGGLAFIAIILFLCLWRRRRQRRSTKVGSSSGLFDSGGTLVPFMSTQPQYSQHHPYYTSTKFPHDARFVKPALRPYGTQHHSQNQLLSHSPPLFRQLSTNTSNDTSLTHTPPSLGTSGDVNGYAAGPAPGERGEGNGQVSASELAVALVTHQDSGIRFRPSQINVIVQNIPPTYTSA